MKNEIPALSLAEQEVVKNAFKVFQRTMIDSLNYAPEDDLAQTAKTVLMSAKRFLGMSIQGGHLAKYEDLKINQDLTLFVTVYPHKDKTPMPLVIHLRSEQ